MWWFHGCEALVAAHVVTYFTEQAGGGSKDFNFHDLLVTDLITERPPSGRLSYHRLRLPLEISFRSTSDYTCK